MKLINRIWKIKNIEFILFMLFSMACFTVRDAISKQLSEIMPISQILIIIGLIGTILFFIIALLSKQLLFYSELKSFPFVIRFFCELFSSVLFVISIVFGSLAISSAIMQTIPIFVALGTILFFEQKVRLKSWLMILSGLAGVVLIIKPGTEHFDKFAILALLSVLFLAGKDLTTHHIRETVSPITLCFWGFFALMIGGILCVPIFGDLQAISLNQTPLLVLLGLFTPMAYFTLILATRGGDISIISPFRYSRLLFALAVGVIFFHEEVDVLSMVGCVMIVISGIALIVSSSTAQK